MGKSKKKNKKRAVETGAKTFDDFPQWCQKIADKYFYSKVTKFSDIIDDCAKMISQTSELEAVKLFLLMIVKAYIGYYFVDGIFVTEKEAAQKINDLARELRGDETDVLDDYPLREQKRHDEDNLPEIVPAETYDDLIEKLDNISQEEMEALLEANDPAALCYIGVIYFWQIDFDVLYVQKEGDNGYDYMAFINNKNEDLWQKALALLRASAGQGFACAQYELAMSYLHYAQTLDKVIYKNTYYYDHAYYWGEIAIEPCCSRIFVCGAQALAWLRKAAAQGYAPAIEKLSEYYEDDGFEFEHGGVTYVTRNRGEKTAEQIAEKEQEKAERDAEKTKAAAAYVQGEDAMAKKDYRGAVIAFKEALHITLDKNYDKSLAKAIRALGFKPLAEADREKAEELYRQGNEARSKMYHNIYFWEAALMGHFPSADELCTHYIISTATSQTGQAIREKLAEAGYAKAQYDLGDRYYYGNEIKQNIPKAIELYKKAAAQGYKDAIRTLKYLKKEGEI